MRFHVLWLPTVGLAEPVKVPLLEAARWALTTSYAQSCADSGVTFEACDQPWSAVEAWRYACANLLASEALGEGPRPGAASAAREAAKAVASFFGTPDATTFSKASAAAAILRRHILKEDLPLQGTSATSGPGRPTCRLELSEAAGLGVPFPMVSVLIQKPATLQLKSGAVMPLLALAVSGHRRPSVIDIAEALELGVRHLQVSPSVVHAVSQAVQLSQVPRVEIFMSMIWEQSLDSAAKLQTLREQIGDIDLLVVPRSPHPERLWRHLERLKAKGLLKALGVKDFRPEEVQFLPRDGAAVEYALCAFTPYRHGPSRETWRLFGQQEIALAATGLLSDWPRPLLPREDPHVKTIAKRLGRTGAQVLLRWALQLGLAVTFHAERKQHVMENLEALDFELSVTDLRLISGLATLAEPLPPGDGFAHPYEKLPISSKATREL